MLKPAYERIYESLRAKIISGDYAYGSRIPGKRALAEQSGVSVITAAHALDLLAEEGYIAVRERSGSYVAYYPASEEMPRTEPDPVSSVPREQPSSIDVEGFPASVLAKTMRRIITEKMDQILSKSPNQGLLPLRQALSHYLARSRGISAEPDQIIVGSGAEYLYGLLVDLFGVSRSWAIESPSYEKIGQVYASRGIEPEHIPLERDGLQSAALWKSKAEILHVSPYRSYPSDVTASASKRSEYLRWSRQEGRLIIEDDYESEFDLRRKPMESLYVQTDRENIIYMNTFSRTVSPSIRTGYMVLPRALLALYQEKAGFYSCTVPSFEQLLLAELISGGDFERHIRKVRRRLRAAAQSVRG